MRPSYMRTFVL